MMRLFLFSFFSLKFHFIWGWGFKGRGWIRGDGEMNGIETHDVKVTKNEKKIKNDLYKTCSYDAEVQLITCLSHLS